MTQIFLICVNLRTEIYFGALQKTEIGNVVWCRDRGVLTVDSGAFSDGETSFGGCS